MKIKVNKINAFLTNLNQKFPEYKMNYSLNRIPTNSLGTKMKNFKANYYKANKYIFNIQD